MTYAYFVKHARRFHFVGLCKKVELRSVLKIEQNKIMGYVQI